MTNEELHNLVVEARKVWDNGNQNDDTWRDKYDNLIDQVAQEIYQRYGYNEWLNLSMGAEMYLLNHKNIDLEQLALTDTDLCDKWFSKHIDQAVKHLKAMFGKPYEEYDPIESTLIEVIYHYLYPNNEYDPNKYHPVRFYVEFGIKPNMETFNQIDGAEIGGWCYIWEDPQKLLDKYNSLSIPLQHPSRQETMDLLTSNENATQMTIFDIK